MYFLLKIVLSVAVAAVLSCNGKPAPQADRSPSQSPPALPLEYVQRCTGGAPLNGDLPTVVAVHGLGDRPENFARLFDDLNAQVRVLLPQAPAPYRGGYSWFDIRLPLSISDKSIEKGVARASDRLAAFIRFVRRERPSIGRPLLTGFSQGGAISFATAVRHPELIAAALPLSGALPAGIRPIRTNKAPFPPIRAVHGSEDPLIPVTAAQKTAERLRTEGVDVKLTVYEGLGHSVDRRARNFLYAQIREFASSR